MVAPQSVMVTAEFAGSSAVAVVNTMKSDVGDAAVVPVAMAIVTVGVTVVLKKFVG